MSDEPSLTVYAVALTSLHGKVVYDVGTNRGAFAAVEMAMQRWSQFGESTGDVIHIQAGVK
jgi:hypothetical protein